MNLLPALEVYEASSGSHGALPASIFYWKVNSTGNGGKADKICLGETSIAKLEAVSE